MARLKRKVALYHSFYFDPRDFRRRYRVPCSPATRAVTIHRVDIDVLISRQGASIGCTNSNCAVRVGEAIFGHPVYLAEFTKTSAYIVDKLDRDGLPKHCVWYKHDDGESIDLNDHVMSRLELLAKLDMMKPITLRPPVVRLGQDSGPHRTKQAPRDQETKRRRAVPHGALRRAQEAGLFIMQK